jgi:hypothetical protein
MIASFPCADSNVGSALMFSPGQIEIALVGSKTIMERLPQQALHISATSSTKLIQAPCTS